MDPETLGICNSTTAGSETSDELSHLAYSSVFLLSMNDFTKRLTMLLKWL